MSSAEDTEVRGDAADDPDLADLFDELEQLADLVQGEAARDQVEETMRVATAASRSEGTSGRVVWGYDRTDLARAQVRG